MGTSSQSHAESKRLNVHDDSASWPRRSFGPMAAPASAEPPAQQRPAGKGKAVAGEDRSAAVKKIIKKKPSKVLTRMFQTVRFAPISSSR